MIERPGPSKHLSTLKDRYQCEKNFKYFVWITEDIPRDQTEHFSRNISRSLIFTALDKNLSERVPQEL